MLRDQSSGGLDEEEEDDDGYTLDHLSAVIRPVAITMVLASLAVSKIREPSIDSGISGGLSAYLVYNQGTGSGDSGGGGQSTGDLIGQALINAVVIVCVIAAATFVLVACYYFRLLKLMVAYLIFASMNLLGYSGGFMVVTAITVWKLPVDWATVAFVMFNFAVGGVVAVFWQKGVPRGITQSYLVAVSVIMAWILTKLPEWTSWALLLALAVYDLCAVLTPCGPLKWLVNLAQKRQDPIPGLLYEANVGSSSGGGGSGQVRDTFSSGSGRRAQQPGGEGGASTTGPRRAPVASVDDAAAIAQRRMTELLRQQQPPHVEASTGAPGTTPQVAADAAFAARLQAAETGAGEETAPAASQRVADNLVPDWAPPSKSPGRSASGRTLGGGGPGFKQAPLVPASVSADGASPDSRTVPLVYAGDRDSSDAASHAGTRAPGERTFDDDGSGERSIKLGLGDFVFYSVLVSRAALFDVSTFAACFVAVLCGLAGTLFLLGIFRMALPALPISIFLGVALYFVTRLAVTPLIVEMSLNGVAL